MGKIDRREFVKLAGIGGVVFTPKWDWATRDGSSVISALMPHKNVAVFYGPAFIEKKRRFAAWEQVVDDQEAA